MKTIQAKDTECPSNSFLHMIWPVSVTVVRRHALSIWQGGYGAFFASNPIR